jgi:hypothetical protein
VCVILLLSFSIHVELEPKYGASTNSFFFCVPESFWSSFIHSLCGQNWDGSTLTFVTCPLAELAEIGVIQSVEDFR